MVQPVNWKMISHPMNWVVIILMLIIAGTLGHFVLSYFHIEPATAASTYDTVGNGQVPASVAVSTITAQSAPLPN